MLRFFLLFLPEEKVLRVSFARQTRVERGKEGEMPR